MTIGNAGASSPPISLLVSEPAVRRLLREKSRVARVRQTTSPIYGWSQGEIERLRSRWLQAFLRRHRRWKLTLRFLSTVFLATALFCLSRSLDGFVSFLATIPGIQEPEAAVRIVDVWGFYCRQPQCASQKQCRKAIAKRHRGHATRSPSRLE